MRYTWQRDCECKAEQPSGAWRTRLVRDGERWVIVRRFVQGPSCDACGRASAVVQEVTSE